MLPNANPGSSATEAVLLERMLYPKQPSMPPDNGAVKDASPGVNEKISRKTLYGNRTQAGAGLLIPG